MSLEPAPSATAPSGWRAARRDLACLLLLTLLARGGVLLLLPGQLAKDPDGYRFLARNVLTHGVLGAGDVPSAYRPPLYPLLLAGWLGACGDSSLAIGALHLLLGVLTTWMVFCLGRRLGLERLSLLAAAWTALDPLLLNQSTLPMTETLATFLATAAWVALVRMTSASAGSRAAIGWSVCAGCLLGLAALCRPTFLPWIAFLAPALAIALRGPRRWVRLAACGAALAVALLPWVARNQWRLGSPILGTTHGGYTLLLANNPMVYDHLRTAPWGVPWQADKFDDQVRRERAAHPGSELVQDRREYAAAWQAMRNDPGLAAWAALTRIGRLWSPLPHPLTADESLSRRALRYAVCVWYLAQYALALYGLAVLGRSAWRSDWVWGLLLALSLTATHALYWSDLRMRAPVIPLVTLLATAGAVCFRQSSRKLQVIS